MLHPKLYGLILSGGKSTRMGSDKGLLEYHGKPQREYLFELCEQLCDGVYYSIQKSQETVFVNKPTIVDQNEFRGPFNGMLSAHKKHKDAAWLVLACDLPLIDKLTISQLIKERDTTKNATSFATKKTKLPEPLITIWEPNGLASAYHYMQTAESSCPRKFLLNSDIKLVFPKNDTVLYNANSLEEYRYAKNLLNNV